jgi:Rrf2 family protein
MFKMAVSTKTEYALRALLELTGDGGGSLSAQAICARQNLPKKYVEHLLGAMKNAGIIESSQGSKGGYTLSRPSHKITLYDVMRAVDDSNHEMECGKSGPYCRGESCRLGGLFDEIATRQRRLLNSYTLAEIGKIYHGAT